MLYSVYVHSKNNIPILYGRPFNDMNVCLGRVHATSYNTVFICRRIKPNDTLILKAVVCSLKIRWTISVKVDAVISCRVKLYRSWTRLPVASSVRMDCQCCLYKALVSGSSGRTSVSAATRLFSWWVFVGGDTVRRCFGVGPDSGAAGLVIGSLCLASGLSCWTRWRARMSSLLTYWPHTPQVKL
jgi:hypothetical protein